MKLAAAVLATMLSGCGTLMTQSGDFTQAPCEPASPPPMPRVYSGGALDLWAVAEGGPGSQIGALLFWDIPFSLVADTLVLPYTIVTQVQHCNLRCSGGEAAPAADTAAEPAS